MLSLAVEVPLAVGLAAGARWASGGAALGRLALLACAATLLTHPFAWATFRGLQGALPWATRAVLVEGAVVLVEGALYARVAGLGARRGLALALAANGASFGIGLVFTRLV